MYARMCGRTNSALLGCKFSTTDATNSSLLTGSSDATTTTGAVSTTAATSATATSGVVVVVSVGCPMGLTEKGVSERR